MLKKAILAATLATLLTASPALAQNSSETNADQDITGDTAVTAATDATQGDFTAVPVTNQTMNIVAGGDVVATQTAAPISAQAQIPVNAAVNAQQVPVSAAADIEDVTVDLLGGGGQ
jgi:hypothetical protein